VRIERCQDTPETLDFAEFCASVSAKLAAGASVWDCRDELRGLSQNKAVLMDRIHAYLEDLWGPETRGAPCTPGAIVQDNVRVAPNRYYRVRCLFWEEADHVGERNPLFLYDSVPHDHNFELLTIGHAGPGYRTSIWEYDRASTVGYVGEKVTLRSRGHHTLAPDTVLWFQQNRDLHVQHGPAAASISLNLITWNEPQPRQFFFDLERQRISHLVPFVAEKRQPLFALAAVLGDGNTLDLLSELIAQGELHPVMQQSATAAAAHIYERLDAQGDEG